MGAWSMNAQQITDAADTIAENAFLKLIGRAGMVAALPVVLAGGTWLGNTLWTLNGEQARLSGQIAVLTSRIELQMSDRYRGADADRDFKLRDQKVIDLERRVTSIEARLETRIRRVPTSPQ